MNISIKYLLFVMLASLVNMHASRNMIQNNIPTGSGVALTGRWAYILVLLCVMHVLMDARDRIVVFFPSRAVGFITLAAAYAALSQLLIAWKPSTVGLFGRFDVWIRANMLDLFSDRQQGRKPIICAVIILMTAAGCLLRWVYIIRTPVSAHIADMLPLIYGACETLISGANPYNKVYEMPWKLPLTFWPGLWMPYLIPHIIGRDL